MTERGSSAADRAVPRLAAARQFGVITFEQLRACGLESALAWSSAWPRRRLQRIVARVYAFSATASSGSRAVYSVPSFRAGRGRS